VTQVILFGVRVADQSNADSQLLPSVRGVKRDNNKISLVDVQA